MSSLLIILLSAVLVNIMALTSTHRWRTFEATDGVFPGAVAVAISCLIIVPGASILTWLLGHVVLAALGLQYLRTAAFVAVVLIVVGLAEVALRKYTRVLPARPGFALLMTANAMVFGMALTTDARAHSLLDAFAFSAGGAILLAASLLAYAALHERFRELDIPVPFRGAPLALITAGIIALAFMGFTGLIQE